MKKVIIVILILLFVLSTSFLFALGGESNERKMKCDNCWGKGTAYCVQCSGTGKTYEGKRCKYCKGSGKVTCRKCNGKGYYNLPPANEAVF